MPTLREIPKTQLVLAACGVLTLVAATAAGVMLLMPGEPPRVSELALHPEQQDEILARREAEKLQKQIDLSAEQTDQVAELWLKYRKQAQATPAAGSAGQMQMVGRMMSRMQLSSDIRKLLTPEQQTAFDDTPDGRRQNMMQMFQNSTPEQRRAFGEQMRERMPKGFGGGPPPPGGFPDFPQSSPPNGN